MGILSSTHGTLNGGLSGNALIMDTVVLTLTGVSNDLVGQSLDNLTGISFLYGTSPDATLPGTVTITEDSGAGPAPEPATLGILGTSLLGLAAVRRRSRR